MGKILETFKPKTGISLLNARIKSFMQKSFWGLIFVVIFFSPYLIMLCATYIILCINLVVYLPIAIIIMGWEGALNLFLTEIKNGTKMFKDVT